MFRLPVWMRVLRLMSLAFGAGLVLLTLFIARSGEHDRRRDSADSALLNGAQAERQALEDYFGRARSVILLTARNPAMRDLYMRGGHDPSRIVRDVNGTLEYLERLYPDSIGEACVIDREGVERARVVREVWAGREDLSKEESGNDFFAPTFALPPGRVHQALPYVSQDTDEWVISNSTPMPLPGRAARAIVHFEVTVESFRRAAAAVDKRLVTRIVDPSTRRVVLDSRHPQRVGAPLGTAADPALLSALRVAAGSDRGVLTTIGGERAAIRPLRAGAENANRWYVVVTAPSGATASGWDLGTGAIVLLLVGLVFVGVALATFRFHSHVLEQAAVTDGSRICPTARCCSTVRIRRSTMRAGRAGMPPC